MQAQVTDGTETALSVGKLETPGMTPNRELRIADAGALAALVSMTIAAYHRLAPDSTLNQRAALELSRIGGMHISADLYDFAAQTHLVATAPAGQAAFVRTPPTFPFDGLWVETDGVVVYGQPRGRAYHVSDGLTFADPAKWTTTGTDWTVAANKATHVVGANSDDLVATLDVPLKVGQPYCVYVKGVKTAGTSLTAYCGTAAGTAITANGAFEFIQPLVCTGSSTAKLACTTDFDGYVTHYQIFGRTPKLSAKNYAPFALAEVVGVAAGSALTTLLVATACDVHGLYRRVPGATDLG